MKEFGKDTKLTKKKKPKMNTEPRTDKPIMCCFGFKPQPIIPADIQPNTKVAETATILL